MGGGSLGAEALTAYETLIDRFDEASSRANCGSVRWTKPLVSRFRRAQDNSVIFDGYLHLKNWKIRKQAVSVLIQVQETIRRGQPPVLVKSTVRVCYFDVGQEQSSLMQSVRFDFDEGRPCHPIFHAQLSSEAVTLPQQDADALDFELPTEIPKATCFKDARIPTSDMTFPSVLLCIAADHMGPEFFLEFMESVRDIHARMPLPAFERLQSSIARERNHLRSFHWYSHML